LNRLDEAANYSDRAYGIAQRTGDEVTRVLLERAKIYMAQHNPLRAAIILADVESRLTKSLPAGHFALGVLSSEKALNALLQKDVTSALDLANRGVSIVESAIKAGGEGGYYLPRILTRRSVIEMAAQRPLEAADDAARAVLLFQAELEPGRFSSHLGNAYLALGQALLSQGKPEEAHVAFSSAAENLESTVGMNHPDCRTARELAAIPTAGPKHLK
jgi:tetratricopeptide (TPR) repeat protein